LRNAHKIFDTKIPGTEFCGKTRFLTRAIMPFNSQSAYAHTKNIAFPRLVGSTNERKAIEYIKNAFEVAGLEVELQNFHFNPIAMEIYSRFIFLLPIIAIWVVFFIYARNPVVAFSICVAMFVAILILTRWKITLEKLYNVGKQRHAQNIIARKPTNAERAINLIYVAHYDSKSQTLPIGVRVITYCAVALGMLGLTVVCFVAIALKLTSPGWILGLSLYTSTLLLALQFNFTGNASPGAHDNASGVGVLLELAQSLNGEKLENLNLTFLATSAEELGLVGAIRYIEQYGEQLNTEKTYFVNFDGVGASGNLSVISKYGIPPCHTGKRLSKLLKECGEKLNIALRDIYSPAGVFFDHIPIASRGFESVTISASNYKRTAFGIHSKRDRIENIEIAGLKNAGELACELARMCSQQTSEKL